jgi:hypothetical protein
LTVTVTIDKIYSDRLVLIAGIANIDAVNEVPDKGKPIGLGSEAEYKALVRKMRD